jgi:tetratricopeptide (TPR) repeat protein
MFSGRGRYALVTTLELFNPRYSPASFHIGQEVRHRNIFSLRLGLDDTSPTFGFGAEYRNVAIDYAYRSQDFDVNNHRVSLSIKLGASLEEKRAVVRQEREAEVNETINQRMSDLEKSQIDGTIEKGRTALNAKDYGSALEHFEMAILWDPDNAEARRLVNEARYEQAINVGAEEMENENYVAALINLRNAARCKPDDARALSMIAMCDKKITEAEISSQALNRMLRAAVDLYAENQLADAMAGFQEVLKIASDNEFAREYHEKCAANIRSLIQKNRRDAARIAADGDFDGAIMLTEQALSYGPNDKGLRGDLEKYRRLRRKAIEREALDARADGTIPDPEPSRPPMSSATRQLLDSKYNQGMKHFDDGDFDLAIESFRDVWSTDPNFHNVTALLTKAYLLVGMTHYSDQNYHSAIRVWEMALTVDPDNSKAKRYLSKANEELKRLDRVFGDD